MFFFYTFTYVICSLYICPSCTLFPLFIYVQLWLNSYDYCSTTEGVVKEDPLLCVFLLVAPQMFCFRKCLWIICSVLGGLEGVI